MDGNQLLDFYWIDPIEAIIRFVAKQEYNGKLYTQFVPGTSYLNPGQRAFGACANSGMVFEAAQLIDVNSSPVLALFFSDASFAGQHMSHHPIYCTSCLFALFDRFNYCDNCNYFTSVCLLNLHENERCKPAAWIPVGWLPSYIDARAKGLRPKQGYESIPARKMRLFHRCWIEFLDGWAERTRDAMILTWADGVQRSSRIFLGGLLGDQQEGDKFTGEPCVCHRCFAARKHYLVSDAPAQAKSSKRMRLRVEAAAAGAHLKGAARDKWVVKWDPDGRNVRPGPGIP